MSRYIVKVQGKTLATFADYATWDAVQDAMKCARKDCGVSWSNSVDCATWTIDYWEPCERDGYILTYYRELEAMRARIIAQDKEDGGRPTENAA